MRRYHDSRLEVCALPLLAALLPLGLNAETNFQFRARLLEVHAPHVRAEASPAAADETIIDGSWRICATMADPVVRHAAEDLADYFQKSMKIGIPAEKAYPLLRVAVRPSEGAGETVCSQREIVLAVDPKMERLQSRIDVCERLIRITGGTPREAFQGVTRLEDEMNARGCPVVKRGSRTYTRMFSPRMTHSGYAVETFPDAYLDQIVHAGMDAILVFIEDPPDVTRCGRIDMPALVRRAAAHGIDVWAYANFPKKAAKMHPLDPDARAWYDATYGTIVKNAPGLKGLICVGESCAFPSRDPGMRGYWWQENRQPDWKLNGFWPVSDWPVWLDLVKEVTRRYNPDFKIVFWTYNWFRKPAEIRLPLIERIPTDLTLLVTWVRGDKPVLKCGVPTLVTDYSVTLPGPSAVFRSEADVAVRRGIPVMTMANTGGRTWDCGVTPFIPALGCWRKRFDALKAGQRRWGIAALMESHHYGFQPSLVSALAKVAFTCETTAASYVCAERSLLVATFGEKAADAAAEAFAEWDAAMSWHQTNDWDFWGPLRVGPAYPLHLPGEKLPQRPDEKWMYMMPSFGCPTNDVAGYVELADRELRHLTAGVRKLAVAMGEVPVDRRDAARRILGVGDFYRHSVMTLRNAYRYFGAAKAKNDDALRQIVADERANVLATIPLVEFDSSLGWEPTMGYVCDRKALEWKLESLRQGK